MSNSISVFFFALLLNCFHYLWPTVRTSQEFCYTLRELEQSLHIIAMDVLGANDPLYLVPALEFRHLFGLQMTFNVKKLKFRIECILMKNNYLNKDGLEIMVRTNLILSDNLHAALNNKTGFFYFICEIEYLNLVTEKKNKYRFVAELLDFNEGNEQQYTIF